MKFRIENIEDLSDSREIMEMRPNKFVRIFIYILLLSISVFLLWSWFSEKEIVIKTSGIVSIKENFSTISNKISGTIKEVYIKDGQLLKKGDLMYLIDDTDLQNTKNRLEKDKTRIENKLKNIDKLTKSIKNDINYFTDCEEEKEYYYKYKTYEAGNLISIEEKNSLIKSKSNLNNKIKNLKLLDKSIDNNIDYNSKDSTYTIQFNNFQIEKKEIENTINKLEESKKDLINQNVPNQEILQIDSEIEINKNKLSKLKNDIKLQIQNSIDELNIQIINIENNINKFDQNVNLSKEKNKLNLLSDIESQKSLINVDLQEIKFNLDQVNTSIERCQVKCESNGKIDIKMNLKPGSTIESGIIIGNILPTENEYKVDLIIPEKDIANLKEGQDIKYTFNSLPYNEYGFLTGEIKNLSITSKINSENGSIFYTGEGSLENNALYRSNGEKSEIKSGMSCEARVIVRKTKMLYYFLEKLNFITKS